MLYRVYSPPYVDRIWLWVYYNKVPIYPIFYRLDGDYRGWDWDEAFLIFPYSLSFSHVGFNSFSSKVLEGQTARESSRHFPYTVSRIMSFYRHGF